MFEFIKDLNESRLFPNVQELRKHTDKELAEWLILNLCALRILLAVESSCDWARVYARKTASHGSFTKYRSDGTDLYVLLQSISEVNSGKKNDIGYGLNMPNVLSWLRQGAMREPDETITRRLFVRLDYDLKIRDESLRAIRRLTLNWHTIDKYKKQLLFTRILQFFRTKMRRSEILIQLERVAKNHDLLLHRDDPDAEIKQY